MPSFLDVNLAARDELKLIPDNTECLVRIKFADITENRKDASRSNLALVFEACDEPLAEDIRMWIPIPTDEQRAVDPKAHSRAMQRLEQCCLCFDIKRPCETSDMLGKEGWVLLAEDTDLNNNPVNTVRRCLPRRK
jgi:hypothetical protein